jgi:hypothetical protein
MDAQDVYGERYAGSELPYCRGSFPSRHVERRQDDLSKLLAEDAVIEFPYWPVSPKRIEGKSAR